MNEDELFFMHKNCRDCESNPLLISSHPADSQPVNHMFPTDFDPSHTASLIAKMPTSRTIIESAMTKVVAFYATKDGQRIRSLAKAAADLKATVNSTRQNVGHPTHVYSKLGKYRVA
jgi:hypothetical protein